MIDELKDTGDKNNKIIHDRIDRIQIDLKALSKFRMAGWWSFCCWSTLDRCR